MTYEDKSIYEGAWEADVPRGGDIGENQTGNWNWNWIERLIFPYDNRNREMSRKCSVFKLLACLELFRESYQMSFTSVKITKKIVKFTKEASNVLIQKIRKWLTKFSSDCRSVVREVQQDVNLIDLVKIFSMNLWLRKSASIPPWTSFSKFFFFELRDSKFIDPPSPSLASEPMVDEDNCVNM